MCNPRFVLNNGLMQYLHNNNLDATIVYIGTNEGDEDSDIDIDCRTVIKNIALIVFFVMMMVLLAPFCIYFIRLFFYG